jgi:hypothetical protein
MTREDLHEHRCNAASTSSTIGEEHSGSGIASRIEIAAATRSSSSRREPSGPILQKGLQQPQPQQPHEGIDGEVADDLPQEDDGQVCLGRQQLAQGRAFG